MNVNVKDIRANVGGRPKLGFLDAGLARISLESSIPLENNGAGMAVYSRLAGEREISSRYDEAILDSPADLLEREIAGLVVVFPSLVNINWIIDSLRHGIPVFCRQPPLLSSADAVRMVRIARKYNCLFDIDFACRHIKGMPELRQHIRQGDLGNIHVLDLTLRFGKSEIEGLNLEKSVDWRFVVFHLFDLVLWLFDYPEVTNAKIFSPLENPMIASGGDRQDFALARLDLGKGVTVNMGYAQRDSRDQAVIDMGIYGECDTDTYVTGSDSLFSFVVGHLHNPMENRLDDDLLDPALTAWLKKLGASTDYDENIETFVRVIELIEQASN